MRSLTVEGERGRGEQRKTPTTPHHTPWFSSGIGETERHHDSWLHLFPLHRMGEDGNFKSELDVLGSRFLRGNVYLRIIVDAPHLTATRLRQRWIGLSLHFA